MFISMTILVPDSRGFKWSPDYRNAGVAVRRDAGDVEPLRRDVALELESRPRRRVPVPESAVEVVLTVRISNRSGLPPDFGQQPVHTLHTSVDWSFDHW